MATPRSRLDVYKDLLARVHSGASQPAGLMRGAGIHRGALDQYVESLISLGLLAEVDEGVRRSRLHVTEKGMMVIGYLEFSWGRNSGLESCT